MFNTFIDEELCYSANIHWGYVNEYIISDCFNESFSGCVSET